MTSETCPRCGGPARFDYGGERGEAGPFLVCQTDECGYIQVSADDGRAGEDRPTRYVCGFLFSEDAAQVMLIRKKRSAWQASRLNGIGGKVERGEIAHAAMVREFAEEVGLTISAWRPTVTLLGNLWRVDFFSARGSFVGFRQMTDERVVIRTVDLVVFDPTLIPNLRWLLPLSLDESGVVMPVVVHDGTR